MGWLSPLRKGLQAQEGSCATQDARSDAERLLVKASTLVIMLRKVPVRDLRLGMHLHALEGAWIDHPFWKTRFKLDDPEVLRTIMDSAVTEAWIDVDQGLDVETVVPLPAVALAGESPAAVMDAPVKPILTHHPEAATGMAAELREAANICYRSREAVSSMLHEARLGHAVDAQRCLPVVDEIARSVRRNPGALVSLARLKTKDDYSYMHSVAVCALMVSLAQSQGHDEDATRDAGLAGLVHDLGKAAMPLHILNKPGRLTDEEYAVMRTHPLRGHEMLVEGGNSNAVALDVCLHHHEHVDGKGYPHGLVGDHISLLARMGAVCDVYDAITSNRPYKSGWDPAESVARMASWKGHFDQDVFHAFVKSLGIYPTGSLVRLSSGHLAVVVSQTPQSLTSPVVKVFYSTKSQMPIPATLLDLSRSGTSDRIANRESPSKWSFPHLDELWAGDAALSRCR